MVQGIRGISLAPGYPKADTTIIRRAVLRSYEFQYVSVLASLSRIRTE